MSEKRDSVSPDHQSDPARTPGAGWVGEGGASHLGPATHIRSGHEPQADEQETNDDNADDGE